MATASIRSLTVSWSALRRWEECKAKQGLYLQKKAQKSGGRLFLPGTVADRCMRKWLDSDDPQSGQMVGYIEEVLEEHSGQGSEYVIKWKGDPRRDRRDIIEYVTGALTVLEPILLEKVIPFKYQPEFRFKVPMGLPGPDGRMHIIWLIGGIDILLQDNNDDFEVIDLKLTKDQNYAKKVLGQLFFYSVAISLYFGKPDQPKRAALYMPAAPKPIVPVSVSEEDIRIMRSRIVAYCQGVWSGEFPPNPDDEFCYNCECRVACPKFALPDEVVAQGSRQVSFMEFAERKRALRQSVRDPTVEEPHA